MNDGYYDKLLAVIKKYDPEEYKELMNVPYGGIVEDHLDAILEQYGSAENYEKAIVKALEDAGVEL